MTWGGDSIVQPAVLAGGDLLIGSGSGLAANSGMLRVNVAHESGGMDRERTLDVDSTQAVLQRLRRSPRATPSVSTAAFSRASISRTARASGRADATATASSSCWPTRTFCSCCRKTASWRSCRRPPTNSPSSRASRRSRERPGITRCWPATSCWFATAKRWPRSGWRLCGRADNPVRSVTPENALDSRANHSRTLHGTVSNAPGGDYEIAARLRMFVCHSAG